MVAAVLDLDEGAGAPVHALDQMSGGLAHRHDVVDRATRRGIGECRSRHRPLRVSFSRVAEHEIDLGHGGERAGVDLRGAAGDDDARAGPLAARLADRLAGLAHGLRR